MLCSFSVYVLEADEACCQDFLFQRPNHFVNVITGHINGLGVDVDVGGVAKIIREL